MTREIDSVTGHTSAPSRYMGQGRETIDRIRDILGDEGFISWCQGNVIKYLDRAGLKGCKDDDLAKADFYEAMIAHVVHGTDDPRSQRPDFKLYVRREP